MEFFFGKKLTHDEVKRNIRFKVKRENLLQSTYLIPIGIRNFITVFFFWHIFNSLSGQINQHKLLLQTFSSSKNKSKLTKNVQTLQTCTNSAIFKLSNFFQTLQFFSNSPIFSDSLKYNV